MLRIKRITSVRGLTAESYKIKKILDSAVKPRNNVRNNLATEIKTWIPAFLLCQGFVGQIAGMTAALVISILLLLPSLMFANNFTYKNYPIYPNCLQNFFPITDAKPTKTVSLAQCSPEKLAKTTVIKNNIYSTKQGRAFKPYALYSVMGEKYPHFLLLLGQWTGGSGFFTHIILVKKTNKQLVLEKTLAGGDRCNSGVDKVAPWQYSISLTPSALVQLTKNNPPKIEPFKDLSDCAACCTAKAVYQYNMDSGKPKFLYVTLTNIDLKPDASFEKQYKYEACFDRLYIKLLKNKQTKLNQKALNEFINKFKQQCVK